MARASSKLPLLSGLVLATGVGLLAGLARNSARGKSGNPAVPEPAKPVDPARYMGVWYELSRYRNWFERGCEGVTAEYSKRQDGLIDVVNTCRRQVPDGVARVSKGRARIVTGSGGAKLKVSFFGPFFFGRYWVLDHADDYAWSIVGEPSGRFLWVLARDPSPSQDVYDGLTDRARALGYDLRRFRRTRQLTA